MNLPENLNKTTIPLIPVIVVVGPTAIGKTALSIDLAKKYNAEIVSADSRQIYKYMDIGTAKPLLKEMEGIPHHFIDYISPNQEFSAGDFGNQAREKILHIRKNKKNVIVVGGSGLYIRSLLYGMISFDQRDEKVRNGLTERLKTEGLPQLYLELKQMDPELAERFSENDTQRILRGLEVFQISGQKLSQLQKESEIPAPFKFVQIGLTMERAKLYARVNERVDRMLQSGLLDEVKGLLERGYTKTNALNAVGYKEVINFLDGDIPYEKMLEHIKRNTRRFAKRQMTWFKKDVNINWFSTPITSKEINKIILQR
jgi:tRNA dimethylallyltransferase